jgi:hypothetical protein
MQRAHFSAAAKYSATRSASTRYHGLKVFLFDPRCSILSVMKKILLPLLLTVTPASAQTQLAPKDAARPPAKGAAARVDNCAPIGRTANGELVYSMKCENIPAPRPPPQARLEETTTAPPSPPEPRRSGIFGWSYDRRQPDQ